MVVYLDDLDEAFHLLAEQPLLCRERNELRPPVRIHHHAHHLIVYLAMEDGINIVRVLHENMDIENQLEGTGINQGARSEKRPKMNDHNPVFRPPGL